MKCTFSKKMFVFRNYYRMIYLVLAAILIAGIFVHPVVASVGFQATLEPYPFFVSGYDEVSDKFSAAMYPMSYSPLSLKLKRSPKVTGQSFATNTLTFETQYFQLGTMRKYLVPVSVNANDYLTYRLDKQQREDFTDLATATIADPSKLTRRGGLGITLALPKRLDKVFGEGGAGLKVSGYRRITFSGRSQWSDAAQTDTYRHNKFPSLNMEQISKFDITGTIGSKITVKVSQDSQTDIPLANRLQIRYKGDEDDILKSIEAGNTNLSLPNTRFVGYSQRIQGLFGLKAEAQIGNLTLTGIASQEKGSAERTTFTASGEENAQTIRDYEYARNRIFDLAYIGDTLGYADPFQPGDSIVNLYIYEQVKESGIGDEEVAAAFKAHFWADPTSPDRDALFASEQGKILVKQIEETNYTYEYSDVTGIPYVVFKSPRSESKTIVYYMEVKKSGTGDIVRVGDISQSPNDPANDSLYLKLLSLNRDKTNPAFRSWSLMWRNCYNIPRGVGADDIDLKVLKGLSGTEKSTTENLDYQMSGGETQSYLEILGLDQYNTLNQKVPDGKLDDRSEILRADWGLLIFPSRHPFDTDTTYGNTLPLGEKLPDIYAQTSIVSIAQSSIYYLQLATRTRSSIIRLNHANIIEGSERVMLNGRQLSRGTDYNIQYDFGQVTLMSQEALDPNADISVDFEYAPFLSLQKKSLLGARAEYAWSRDFSFGTTLLYKSDKAQDRKPKVGQETAKMLVLDFDASVKLKPNFLTAAVDALPLVETDVPSNLMLSAEVAQSHPNPNVDNVAYVDDFESALDQLSLGTNRSNWSLAAKPKQLIDAEEENAFLNYQHGRLLWHNPDLGGELVRVEDVFDREARQGEGTLRTFRMIFKPNNLAVTVDTSEVDSSTVTDTTRVPSWAGIMRYFHSRVDAKRVQLFELRAKIDKNARGKLHFDFGQINEDLEFYPEHLDEAFSEDGFASAGVKNGAVDESEDVGLDGLANEDESGYDSETNPDPSGDNWFFLGEGKCPLGADSCAMLADDNSVLWSIPSIRYRWLNGTEGNMRDNSVLGVPDEEALSDNGLNTINAYFSYEMDLQDNPYAVDSSAKGDWLTYRIPIRDPLATDTISEGTIEPNWEQITHVRVWFEADSLTDDTSETTVEIAAWYFVQSNWQDTVQFTPLSNQGSKLTVATISTEDGTFRAPPGVEAYKDPTYNVTEPQRGLLLQFDSLQYLDTVMATKELISVDAYSGYRQMKMYVNLNELTGTDDGVEFFFRLGQDDRNYYEHRAKIYPGVEWDERNYVDINFQDLTAVKDSVLREGARLQDVDVSSGKYRVVGNANLNSIRFFGVGVVNTDSTTKDDALSDVSGEIWLDELRVTDVRRDVGTAGRISANGSIADLFSYNFGLQSKDPYFRGISNATRGGSSNNLGSGQTETSYNYGISFQFDKLLPRSWGARIPINYSFSKRTRVPLLRNGTDIVLPEDIRDQEKSVNESQTIGINGINFNYKGGNPVAKFLLNRLQQTSLSYGLSRAQSVKTPYSYGEKFQAKSGFNLGIKAAPSVPLFFWTKPIPIFKRVAGTKLFLYPTSWTLKGTFNRNLSITDDVSNNRRTTLTRNFTGNMDIGYSLFENLTTSFRYGTVRDMSDLDLVRLSLKNTKLGREMKYTQSFTAGYDPKLLRFITTVFSYKAGYGEDYDKTYDAYRSGLNQSWGVNGTFDHRMLFGGRGGTTDRRFRGRTEVRGGGAKKKKDEKGRPFYDPPLAVLRFLTGWITPFQYKYDESFKNGVPGIVKRPSWQYRFGLTTDPEIDSLVSQNQSPSSSETVSYSLQSGFILLGGLKTDVGFRRAISRDLISRGARYENRSTGWPELNLRIQKFKTLPLLKGIVNRFIDIFSPRTGFSRQTKERINLDLGFVNEKTITTNHSPLLSVNLKLFRSLSMSGSYTLLENETEKFNQATGDFQSQTKSTKKTIAVSTKYSFSSPQGISIPIFGKLKFRSTASFNLDVKLNSNISQTSLVGKDFVDNSNKSDVTISPKISYQFSSQIKGGITGRWQDSKDNRLGKTNHIRELQIWSEIRF